MAENIELRLKLIDEFSAELRKFQAQMTKAETEATRSAKSINTGFGNMRDAIISAGQTAVFSGLVRGMQNVMNAASEAEAVNTRLIASLRATGQYTEATVSGLDAWSLAMMRTKGVDDELAKSLIAEGVAMGKTVEQSKRLAEAAANMAPIVGSVEGAMGLLIRASNGSTEALKRYGIQVSEAEAKSGDFESILKRVEQQFAGQAAAQLETYAGQVKLLAGEFGNLKESLGTPLIAAATDWLTLLNQLIAKHGELDRVMRTSTENSRFADLAKNRDIVFQERENLRKLIAGQSAEWQVDPVGREAIAKLVELNAKLAEMDARMVALRKEAERTSPGNIAAGLTATPAAIMPKTKMADDAEARKAAAKALKEELDAMAASQAAMLKNIGDDSARRFSAQKDGLSEISAKEAVILGQYKAESDMVNKLIADYERLSRAADPEARARFEAQKGAPTQAETMNAVISGKAQAQREMIDNTIADYTSKLKEVTSAEEDKMRAQKEYTDADKVATANAVEAAKKLKFFNVNTELASVALQGIGVAIGTALQGGNVGGALAAFSGQAIGKMVGDKLGVSLGKSLGPAIGGALGPVLGGIAGSLAGGVLDKIIGGKPPTKGEEAQDKLYGLIRDIGVKAGPGRRMSDEDFENLAQGAQDLYKSWAKLLTGEGGELEEQARILAGSFETLDLTTGETSDAIALMKSRAEGTAFMAERQNTAWAALISTADLTTEEFSQLVSSYREGYNWQKQYNDALKQFEKDLQGGAGQDVVIADRQKIVDLLKAQEAAQKKTEQELRDAGMSQDAINKETKSVADNTAEMNTKLGTIVQLLGGTPGGHSGLIPSLHHGRMVGGKPSHLYWIRNDEWVVPPEKMRWAAERMGAMTGGYQPTVTVNLSGVIGDKRAVAREVYGAIQTAMARREI